MVPKKILSKKRNTTFLYESMKAWARLTSFFIQRVFCTPKQQQKLVFVEFSLYLRHL